MGYETHFELNIHGASRNAATSEVAMFFEFEKTKHLSYAELRKRVPDVEKYFSSMEAKHAQLGKLLAKNKSTYGFEGLSIAWSGGGTMKWYQWSEDVKALSQMFPDVVFQLSGEGEEAGDLWVAYFKNGKMQHVKAQITYEPFDPEKLE